MAEETIEIEPLLETVLLHCLDQARQKMESGEAFVPFTAIAEDDSLLMREHDAADADKLFGQARKAVAEAKDAQAYAFCYDGFVEVENAVNGNLMKRDCIIAEGGSRGAEYGHAIGQIYKAEEGGAVKFNAEPIYVSQALNYLVSQEDALEGIETFTGAYDPDEAR